MHTGPLTIATAAFMAMVGLTEGARLLAPSPAVPPVQILSIEVSSGVVRYTREVRADQTIRAPYFSDMVDVETERSVPECARSDRADYGPGEPQTQEWPIDQFFAHGCSAALVPGRKYAAVATVSPIEGPASVKRSPPFVWGEE